MTYTVREKNEMSGRAHFVGTFASYGEAEAYATKQADRVRSFVEYEIWKGTPKNAFEQAGSATFRGKH